MSGSLKAGAFNGQTFDGTASGAFSLSSNVPPDGGTQSLSLNGGYILLPASLSAVNPFRGSGTINGQAGTDFTITCWYQTTDTSSAMILSSAKPVTTGGTVSTNHAMAVYVDPVETAASFREDNFYVAQTRTGANTNNGTWHFGVITFSEATSTFYAILDGTSTGSNSYNPAIPNAQQDMIEIGATQNTTFPESPSNFVGNLSDVAIFQGVLSSSELANVQSGNFSAYYGALANPLPTTTPLAIAASGTLDLNGASQQVVSLSDSTPGSGGSVINSSTAGAALLTLSPSGGSTTFSGTIGGSGAPSGSGPISLVMSGSGTQVLAGSLLGSGDLTVDAGTLVLGASNSLLGVTTLAGGTLQLNNSLALAGQTLTLSATAGVLNTTGLASLTLGGLAGAGNLAAPAGPLTIGGNGMTTTYAGNISGATSLTKTGAGTLYLSGSNSAGNTLVSAGAIEAELAASLSGSVSVAGGAGLIVPTGNGATGWTVSQFGALLASSSFANNSSLLTIDTTNASATIAASINQPLALNIVGGNTLTLGAANTYSGPTTITSGALNLAHNLAVQNSTVTVSSSGALTFAAGITSPTLGGLAGSASLALATAASQPVTLSVGQNGQNTTYGGILSGAGGLNKVAPARWR